MQLSGLLVEIGDDVVIQGDGGQEIVIRGLTHAQVREIATSYQLRVALNIEAVEVAP
ncbi:MAG: hypothetical protein E5299_01503 [Burkholderia gladioli]|nr:MAG: hypothetical protein E5299_01503 [Burkholderia gladioli]